MSEYTSGTSSPAIPVSWAETINQSSTDIKKSHLVELRAALTAMDGHKHVFNSITSGAELPNVSVSYAESNESIVVGVTDVKASHAQEVIDFQKDFEAHYHSVNIGEGGPYNSSAFDPSFTFVDDPVVANQTDIKASAWTELRTHLETYSTHTHTVDCACECTCTCTCTCQCTCTCNCTCTCDCATCG